MFKQIKPFLIFLLSTFSIASVKGNIFTDINDYVIKPVINAAEEVVNRVIDFIPTAAAVRALYWMAKNQRKWECGPDTPKETAIVSHFASEFAVSFQSSCYKKYNKINQCCITHDTCCNAYVPGTGRHERNATCDPPFCSCLMDVTLGDGDVICAGLVGSFCVIVVIQGDKDGQFRNYTTRKTQCEGGERRCLENFEVCTKWCSNKNCANEHNDCMKNACCQGKSRQCRDEQKACYSKCGNTKQQCDDECTSCFNRPSPECKDKSADLCFPSGHEKTFEDAQEKNCRKQSCQEKEDKCEAKRVACYSLCGNDQMYCDDESAKCWAIF
ncbi:hypothetical protein niasHS_008081 [Heterodera schachtii]|uniref:Uncharacterized protein n=1 Tax=Heterodera schachtii TaxID=97005 RepID=A0ABD2J7I0_HETSC